MRIAFSSLLFILLKFMNMNSFFFQFIGIMVSLNIQIEKWQALQTGFCLCVCVCVPLVLGGYFFFIEAQLIYNNM